jgi:hypothetical protein
MSASTVWVLSGRKIEMCQVFFSQETVSSSDTGTDCDTVPGTVESVYVKEESIQFGTEEEEVRNGGVFVEVV